MFSLLVPSGEDERAEWIEELNDDGSAEAWALQQALDHIARLDAERAATEG